MTLVRRADPPLLEITATTTTTTIRSARYWTFPKLPPNHSSTRPTINQPTLLPTHLPTLPTITTTILHLHLLARLVAVRITADPAVAAVADLLVAAAVALLAVVALVAVLGVVPVALVFPDLFDKPLDVIR